MIQIFLTLLFALFTSSCAKVPPYKGKLYIGNSANETLDHEENDTISCQEPKFDEMVCTSWQDFIDEFMIRFQCKQWEPGTELIDAKDIKIPENPNIKKKVEDEIESRR